MGSEGENQKLGFDMGKEQRNWENQRDCDMIRVTRQDDYFRTRTPNWG